MTPAPTDIAKAIAAEINAATWDREFTAVASFADWQAKLEEMRATLLVDVVPGMKPSLELDDRGEVVHLCPCDIAVRYRLNAQDRDDATGRIQWEPVEECVTLLYQLAAYFLPSTDNPSGRRLTTLPDAVWEETDIVSLYNWRRLTESLYVGLIRVTYKFTEAVAEEDDD
jgi:hypothetical protein